MPSVTGFGGANADFHIRLEREAMLHDSNPACFSTSPGGVMRNILENLSHLGDDTALISAVGKDVSGTALLDSCNECGIDTTAIYISKNYSTCGYVDILEPGGDMFVAANDMKLIENLPLSFLHENKSIIKNSKVLIVDTNPSEDAIKEFANLSEGAPLFADPVSCAKAKRLLPILDKITLIKPNIYELATLTNMPCESKEEIEKAADSLLDKGVYSVAVSMGESGVYYADKTGISFYEKLTPAKNVINATGAGDAFLAGLVHAYIKKYEPKEMVRFALAAGKLAVCSKDTINKEMNEQKVLSILEE